MNKTQYQINGFLKFSEEDNYLEGCDPHTTQTFEVNVPFRGDSADEVIKAAAEFLGIEEDGIERNACDEKGRVDFAGMETNDSFSPSKDQIAAWKIGKLRLWYAVYTAHVEKVTPVNLRDV
jgi:hypothetical protein